MVAGNVMGISSILSIDESNCCDLTLIIGDGLPRPPRPPRCLFGSKFLPWYPLDVVPSVMVEVPADWTGTGVLSILTTDMPMSKPQSKLGLLHTA